MRPRLRAPRAVLLAAFLAACAGDAAPGPLAPATPARSVSAAAAAGVRISEIHYDNAGDDAGEAIEVTGPAGTDLTGWSLVRYNGSNGAVYTTPATASALGGVLAASCGGEGVQVVT